MAKVGEGDPRWLVQDRNDGKNVGNWHWSEKSLFPWAKTELEGTFADCLIFENDQHKVWFAGVDSFKGDMYVNNRKGKILFIWDVNLYLKWKGIIKGTGEEPPVYSGKVECTDITVTDDDFNTRFTIDDGDSAKGREVLAVVKAHAVDVVKREFAAMIKKMAEIHQSSSRTDSPGSTSPAPLPKPIAVTPIPTTTTTTTTSGQQLNVRTVSQVVKFHTNSSSLFETLLDPQRVSAFTGSAAQISSEKGSAFKLFGGSVCGVVEDAIPGVKIAQKWRFASWPEDHYSQVTIDLFEDKNGGDKCTVKLTQVGVPEADYDRTRYGWEEHFWRRIKAVFGWSYKVKEQGSNFQRSIKKITIKNVMIHK